MTPGAPTDPDLLLRYRLHPDDVMAHASDFERERRRGIDAFRAAVSLPPP